jgi:enamine deaminase RidA (YjgF/YER057c/UK114 family)
MSKITRTPYSPMLSDAVDYHGFVYLAGMIADDMSKDVAGQTADALAQADALLAKHGSDKAHLLQAQIWLADIRDRDAMNAVWSAWLPPGAAPVRACIEGKMADPRCLVEIIIHACKADHQGH